MGARGGFDEFGQAGRLAAHVVHLDAIAAGQGDQHQLVACQAKHVGRGGTGFDAPLDALGCQVHRHQFVAVLHGRIDRAAFAVDPQMAGGLACGDAVGQRHVLAVPTVDVDMVEPVGRRHKPFHVGRKAQVVGVHHAAHRALNFGSFGVNESQRI